MKFQQQRRVYRSMRAAVIQLRMNIVQYGRLVELPAPSIPAYVKQSVGIQLYTGFHLKPKIGKIPCSKPWVYKK